jgi:hypothetical protein
MSGWYRAVPGAILLLASAFGLAAQEQETHPSPRNANYTIDVRLDPESRTLEGHQTLRWRNIQDRPTDELWFHLYWNAWRNDRSTWMLQRRLAGRGGPVDEIREEDWGSIEVDSIRLLSHGDDLDPRELVTVATFAAPDDENPHDRTVLVVPLPAPVGPGEEIEVELAWRAKIPRTFARTGYRGDYYFFAHWFPKLGVFEGDGWNCHQYHATTEYYSDYGNYRVEMTVPEDWVLGATGLEVDRTANADGTATHFYEQEDVHAFSWTTSPDFVVREARFEVGGLAPVDMRLLIQPEHLGQAERHLTATRAALEHYGKWYGSYPYGHVTVVDPAYGSGSGGMEYPTFFTCGTQIFNPFGGDRPESVTVHEAGHQFWYGLVGNNEFEDAWLDEGLNTFSTIRTLETVYPPRKMVRRYVLPPGQTRSRSAFFPVMFHDIEVPRFVDRLDDYRSSASVDDPSTETFRYFPKTAGNISYAKTALWLGTLERHLGWETLQAILSTFFDRYKLAHPTPEDFFAVADEMSGQDLGWFFDQVHYGSVHFDYAIASVASVPTEPTGLVERDGELVLTEAPDDGGDGLTYRTEVMVRRLGGGIFPVDILLVFEDGHEMLVPWSGGTRSRLVVAERPARLDFAIVDPERTLLLDLNYTNNSRRLDSQPGVPATKWASKWMVWFQDMLSTFTFFM